MKRLRWRHLVSLFVMLALFAASCGSDGDLDVAETVQDAADTAQEAVEEVVEDVVEDEPEPEPTEAPEPADEPDDSSDATDDDTAMAASDDPADAQFVSLQFAPVEEAEKFRDILGDINLTIGEEGPTIDQILAGSESVDVLGALHGTFPPLARENALTNMVDVLDDLSADRDIAPAFVQSGLLGSDDFLAYVPWAQATYIMAANNDALAYLPDGADVQAITWQEFADWCQNIWEGEGTQKCGLPKAGLFHRFLEEPSK